MRANQRKFLRIGCLILIFFIITLVSCTNKGEIKPPETEIIDLQPFYGLSGINIEVGGEDESTPEDKLTFGYNVYRLEKDDQETYREELLEGESTDTMITINPEELGEGAFVIVVAAINEFGVSDKTPPEAEFEVDLTPPQKPDLTYIIDNGEITINCNGDDPDAGGYKLFFNVSGKKQSFSSRVGRFSFKAKKDERYSLKAYKYDMAGNRSAESQLEIDTTINRPPALKGELPQFIGKNTDEIELDIYDDWTSPSEITKAATLGELPIPINDDIAAVDTSKLTEGTTTFQLYLEDNKGSGKTVESQMQVDLTAPVPPQGVELKKSDNAYVVKWQAESSNSEISGYNVYGINKEDEAVHLDSTGDDVFVTGKRYLKYVVTTLDTAGNESQPSYPVRTYSEKYSPVTSAVLNSIDQNTLLTSLYSPYLIDSPITVPDDIILGIEKGVQLRFSGRGALVIKGQVISIPSNSKKTRKVLSEPDGERTLFAIKGGRVWLDSCTIEAGASDTVFSFEKGGSLHTRSLDSSGAGLFMALEDADTIFIEDSRIDAATFAKGTSANTMRLTNCRINSGNGLKINNTQELTMTNTTLNASETAVDLNGFSSAVFCETALNAKNAIILRKLSAVDAKGLKVSASGTGISLLGASTINLRDSEISGGKTGIFVDRSAYLSILNSDVINSGIGIDSLNSQTHFYKTVLRNNGTGIRKKKSFDIEQKALEYMENEQNVVNID